MKKIKGQPLNIEMEIDEYNDVHIFDKSRLCTHCHYYGHTTEECKYQKNELPETAFEAYMSAKYPISREPTREQLSVFNRYNIRDNAYSRENDDLKTAEREYLIGYTRATLNFLTNKRRQMQCFVLDGTQLGMTTALLDTFPDNCSVHITNPCATVMVDVPGCPYNKYAFGGKAVNLYGCMAHEFFNYLAEGVFFKTISPKDTPKYSLVWFDTCGKINQDNLRVVELLFRFRCFREDGPSIFAMTFSSRQNGKEYYSPNEDTMAYNNAMRMDKHLREFVELFEYTVFRPKSAFLPVTKKAMYTLVYCVYPKSWNPDATTRILLEKVLNNAVISNRYARNPQIFTYEFWQPPSVKKRKRLT